MDPAAILSHVPLPRLLERLLVILVCLQVFYNFAVYVFSSYDSAVFRTVFVSTIAGSGIGDVIDGVGTNASFYQPYGLCVDSVGNLFVADYYIPTIRKINTAGFTFEIISGCLASCSPVIVHWQVLSLLLQDP